jgi:hypothetical protein
METTPVISANRRADVPIVDAQSFHQTNHSEAGDQSDTELSLNVL